MVTVNEGRALVVGDTLDLALDTITFLGTINKMKQEKYNDYVIYEKALSRTCKECPEFLETIKEFAVNMTEVFG